MSKALLIKEFKEKYLKVHGVRCKDLTLGDWSLGQLKVGVNTLKFIINKK